MTHHIIASRNYRQENHTGKVFQRGRGSIIVIYPDVAEPDRVTVDWLKEYRNQLPPGTAVVQNGVSFTI